MLLVVQARTQTARIANTHFRCMADDKYRSFQDLAAAERLGEDYAIESRSRPESGVVIIAPHGGTIEPLTDKNADAIAGADFSFYCFRALKRGSGLHIKSHLFNEPWRKQLKKQNFPLGHYFCDALIVGGWDRGGGDRGHFGVRLDIPVED